MLIGVAGNIYNWHLFRTAGRFFDKESILFPFFAFLGLSVMIYPLTKEERISRFGKDQIPFRGLPAGQKILVGTGLIIGIVQWLWLEGLF